MVGGLLRTIIYLVIILIPLAIVTVSAELTEGFIYELGRNAALAAFIILMMQALMGARIKWIERPFGLDILLRFHKYAGIFAAALLILHPVLLSIGPGLEGLFDREKLPVSGRAVTEENVKQQMIDPFENMPSFADRLTDQEIDAIVAHLKTL